ncbi:MAG: hypothetical protein HHAS10_11520 [Candidatus Altimarinota bacterium]
MKFTHFLRDIFFLQKEEKPTELSPRNLTAHYRYENGDIFFDEICVGGNYKNLSHKIERYKYQSARHLSTELVEVLSKCVEVSCFFSQWDDWEVVPIPMHWTRYIFRGFHHTKKIGIEFSKKYNFNFSSPIGTKWTRRQSKLRRKERIQNKKNSFFIKDGYTVSSHIILIDDVTSSGSTFNEAAKVLSLGGAECILCFAIASNA